MKGFRRAFLLMILAIAILFSSAPIWAQGNEPVHVYILMDAGSMFPEETRFAGSITDFAERIKRQNPKNRVSVVVKNDTLSEDSYGYFFGNYGGFTHRVNLIFGNGEHTFKDSIARVKELQKKDDPSYRKVLLIIDNDCDILRTADRAFDFVKSDSDYGRYENLVTRGFMDTMKVAEPFCKNQEVYSIRFPIYSGDGGPKEYAAYTIKTFDLKRRMGTLILHSLQNRGFYEMKESNVGEFESVLRRFEKKIIENKRTRVPAPYTITERIISGGDNDRTYDVSVTVEKKPEAAYLKNLRFKLSLPAGYEIVRDSNEPGYRTESEVKLDKISGKYSDIQWKIRFRGKTPKPGDKITLTYTNDDYLPERSVKQLDIRPMVLRENYWSFPNFAHLKDHVFSNSYVQSLYDSLPPKERKLIDKGMKHNAGGNCYGMAFTSILANENKLDKERLGLKDYDNRPLKNSDTIAKATKDSAKDIIHLYQSSQFWSAPRDKAFRIRKNKTGVQKLVQYMHDVEKNGAPPVLFSYGYKGSDGKHWSHALVMYHMTASDKTGYDYVIDYYDSNDPGALGSTKLYVNSKSGQFISSTASLNVGKISDIAPRIDALDPFKLKEVADEDSVLFIKPGTVFQLESFESKKRWTIDTRNMDRTDLPWSVLAGGEGDSYYAIALPEKGAGYCLMSTEGAKPVDAMVSYKDQLMEAKAEGAIAFAFKPDGSMTLDSAKGRVEAEFVRNSKKGREENYYAVEGTATGTISLSQTADGLKGEGRLDNAKLRYGDGKKREESKKVGNFTGGYFAGAKPTGLPFGDVAERSWYYPAVRYVYEKRLMTGRSENIFSPETSITRAQMAQIIYNMEGGKSAKNPSSFKDVPANHWSFKAVSWAKENNIVAGYGDGSFKPNDPITRQDAVAIMYRYAAKNREASEMKINLDRFKDRGDLSAYAVQPMAWAVEKGIINGDTSGRLNPKSPMKRVEMAQILKNGEKVLR